MILDVNLILLVIAAASFLTGVLHGGTGMAGGVVMAAILAHIIGIKAAVPVMTVALILSHLSRAIMYMQETDWSIAGRVLLFGGPMIVVGAIVFGLISSTTIAVVFAAFLALSLPIKYWALRREIKTGPKLLAAASSVWGMLAGNVIGPGFFLAPFLLGTGMNRLTFVGTLATVTLVMNVIKMSVFGVTDLISWELFFLGVAIGLITIPGNWVGRSVLRRMQDSDHRIIIDILTVLMIINFIYLAIQ
ncbi:MAG: sulfite exporter TauE/SafE family protein [Gammaproteobacteria bacterium]|nr:sulfite exporter TauE/SafE family protein [Gammaproteobacteria bacterium]